MPQTPPRPSTPTNPVLPGFHPDPSVCTVGDWTYLVTSTFEHLPGLPVHRSQDLVHWELVGHAVPRLPELAGVRDSGGLYAPTIRHDGTRFLVVCTLVGGPDDRGHFVVTAPDAAGPWSEPAWLDGDGIDPSILVDPDPDPARPADDDADPGLTGPDASHPDRAAAPPRAWLCATRLAEHPEHAEQTEVWLRELDLASLTLVGEEHVLWRGALRGAVWAEGPHLYRIADGYLLLAAEGGTERHHAVCVATAPHPTGPWTGHPGNPVLTHRHLGRDFPVQDVGHADLVEAPDGRWWAVALATRPVDGCDLLGRETFLTPVGWEGGVPVLAPGVGHLVADPPGLPAPGRATAGEHGAAELTAGDGWVSVRVAPETVARPDGTVTAPADAPAWLLRRLESYDADVLLELDRSPGAGLALRYSDDAWLAVTLEARGPIMKDPSRAPGQVRDDEPPAARHDGPDERSALDVVVRRRAGGAATELERRPVPPGARVRLSAAVRTPDVTLVADVDGVPALSLASDVRHLCPRASGGFVGTTWGVRLEPGGVARVHRAAWRSRG